MLLFSRVIIRGLNPSTAYSVRVYVENGVSKQSDQARPSETINFTTEHSGEYSTTVFDTSIWSAKLYSIFQKLDHLTCNKIPELV